jgi:hypothetical protein
MFSITVEWLESEAVFPSYSDILPTRCRFRGLLLYLITLNGMHTRARARHTHTHTVHSSGRRIGPWQRPPPNNTQHSQETDIHASGGIRTHNASTRAAVAHRAATGTGGKWIKKSNRKGRKDSWPDLNLLHSDGPIDKTTDDCVTCVCRTLFQISNYKYGDTYIWCSYFVLHPSIATLRPHSTTTHLRHLAAKQ